MSMIVHYIDVVYTDKTVELYDDGSGFVGFVDKDRALEVARDLELMPNVITTVLRSYTEM